jgi:hypothetical protein
MNTAVSAVVIAVAVMAVAAGAQETVALRGEMFMAGKTPIDPPSTEPKGSHAYMTVTGAAALRMYRQMRAKAEPNLCEEGKTMKRSGPLACSLSANGREASCDFSIDLHKGRLDDGRPC